MEIVMAFIDGFDRYLLEEAGMDQGQKRAKHRTEMIAAVRSVGKCAMAITILAVVLYCTGCISTTIRNDGSGTVNVFVEKRISTDASIPASIIP
jgi:hypothetical protein